MMNNGRLVGSITAGILTAVVVGLGFAFQNPSLLFGSSSSITSYSGGSAELYSCGTTSKMTSVNGSLYCVDDVTSNVMFQNPGYSYFLNESVNFMGVKFETYCPPNFYGCPGGTNGSNPTIVLIAAIKMNLTFPGHVNETISRVIGHSDEVTVLSMHSNPRAGVLIRYTNQSYQMFLLVQASSNSVSRTSKTV
jgi:hypothetical protein